MPSAIRYCLVAALLCGVAPLCSVSAQTTQLELQARDHVVYIGNTMADRMQHHGWLETYLVALHPNLDLTFRNLGFAGDEVKTRPRSENFGSPDQWLSKTKADVIFCFFGYNEALRGEAGLPQFEKDLREMLEGMKLQQYNGKSSARIVVFSPIAHENLNNRHLPDGSENNAKLATYTEAMGRICRDLNVRFVDLFHPTLELYKSSERPLTMNGIHLLSHGNRAVADIMIKQLFGADTEVTTRPAELERLREAILEKNLYWFSRYRVVDGYNVYGGRSKLAWFGQSNADVMRREMEIFDVMTANRDERVWAVAKGSDLRVRDDNIPELLDVKTNRPGDRPDGSYSYLDGEEAIGKMTMAKGMKVNLFASEDMFPEMVNPVQMAVDTDGRLFVSVWPSYPHWNPTQPRTDRIVCLPDDDGDGVADRCVVFADKLNSITGFEFWGGGMLVAAPPEIWFLKDTDGDDKADFRLRMLQGVSSADTHHTANAMVIGPDGGLYWSRGVFHVTNMETPTKTFRSTRTGVYRFDPRTYEIDFHFPIGPNPHGDVFDQWGYQFANDGTSGTGSYVNIGKGVGNKQWFKKRVRPVAATGILSSSHFPEENNGNFLICNTIGFLGVLQHKVKYNGADITAEEIEPILVSTDPNFRPTDLEIGGDGALYVSDWSNALIGHMQHNIRDPNRDHAHGRIYRVTYEGRDLLEPVKLKGKPIPTVLNAFFAKENGTRYRARLELSGRDSEQVQAAVKTWTQGLSGNSPAEEQALLECLWVLEEHRLPDEALLKRVFAAKEPRVRAAAIRTLGHWGESVPGWQPLLSQAARDDSALVRAEAVKAAVSFEGLAAAEVIFQVANLPTDPELDTVLNYARGQLNVDRIVQDALKSGQTLSVAAQTYVLRNASVADLLKMEPSEAVYRAILGRDQVSRNQLSAAVNGLARLTNANTLSLLLEQLKTQDAKQLRTSVRGLGALLAEQSADDLSSVRESLKALASNGQTPEARQSALAAWIAADGSAETIYASLRDNKERLNDLINSMSLIASNQARVELFHQLTPLLKELPPALAAAGGALPAQGVKVEYYSPNPSNVAIETLQKLEPKASGIVPQFTMNVPQLLSRDEFALKFSGSVQIDRAGKYTFYTSSDDGSRLYIGNEMVVNNDGLHGMVQKSGSIELAAGMHPIVVTYFDNGGGDGLQVSYQGPGIRKQAIPTNKLFSTGTDTLQDSIIRTFEFVEGLEREKFALLAPLAQSDSHRLSAVEGILKIDRGSWDAAQAGAIASSLVEAIGKTPAKYRTAQPTLNAMKLTDELAKLLPADQARSLQSQLAELAVNVVRIGSVPHRMAFDKERIVVQAGKPVEIIFTNSDNMPHNFAIAQPGTLETVGQLAEATSREPDAMARGYIPKTDDILLASRLLQPSESQALSFEAPREPGIYPYVCTYPGHWRRMYGALYVVADVQAYLANPTEYVAEHSLEMKDELLKYSARNTEWRYEELVDAVTALTKSDSMTHRSFEVGKTVFRVANCVACHQLNGEGKNFGPDLTQLKDKKHDVTYILRSLINPDQDIDEKYRSYVFALASGQVVSGLVVAEDKDTIQIVVDPLVNSDPTVIRKSEIEDRAKLSVSTMPKGLANRLSLEEILDLIAYIYSKGDPKHMLFDHGDHQH